MRVVVLGSQGALGRELSKLYAPHQPQLLDQKELDITDHTAVADKLAEFQPEIVFNCAAYNNLDQAETEARDLALRVNGAAVGNLATICREIGAVLVHYSTNYVFDGKQPGGYGESDQPYPLNVYGESKLLGEQELQQHGVNFFLIRTAWLFAGVQGAGGKKSFVELMRELAAKQSSLKIVNDEFGNPTSVKDLALATQQLLEGGQPFGIYHLTNSGVASWYEWSQEIFKLLGQNVTIEPVSGASFQRPATRPKFGALLNTKTAPLRSWQDALKEYLSANP